MYPDTFLSHNYYATLAEPANPIEQDTDDDSCKQKQPAQPVQVLPPASNPPKKNRPSKRVNWATTLAPNQDKPKRIPRTTEEHYNTVQNHHQGRLMTTTQHRKTQRARAIIDSGATGHYGSSEGEWIQTTTPSHKIVGLADGSPVAASVTATLPYHDLPQEAKDGDIIPGLKNDLVSVKKLADARLTTILHEHGVEVYPSDALTIIATAGPVLRGCRDRAGLWRVTDSPAAQRSITWGNTTKAKAIEQQLTANAVFDLPSIGQTIKWHHASLGFPTKDTLLKSINAGNFVTWPLLTQHNVSKHFPESDETIMGHTNQQRQGVRSTKPKTTPTDTDPVTTATNMEPTETIHMVVYELTHTIYSDQTGRLPYRSRTGNQYIMVILQ